MNQGSRHISKLAPKETLACWHVANGATNKSGAKAMGISASTFTKNLQRAMYKLGTYTRAETVAVAIRQGLISGLVLIVSLQLVVPNEKLSRATNFRFHRQHFPVRKNEG